MKTPKFLKLTPEEEKKIQAFENADKESYRLQAKLLQHLVENQLITQETFDNFGLPQSSTANIGKQQEAAEEIAKAICRMTEGSEIATTAEELDQAYSEAKKAAYYLNKQISIFTWIKKELDEILNKKTQES